MLDLYLATQNPHKVEEIASLLAGYFHIKSISDFAIQEEIPETGATLAENSLQKATYIAERFKVNCLADDSGLEVEALQGLPGVHSARYAGEPKSDAANSAKLRQALAGIENRRARFVTVLTFYFEGQYVQFEGEIQGHIIEEPRGQFGFGYDPLFVPENQTLTFAEMTIDQKNQMAHRARALKKFILFVDETLKYHDE